MNDLSSVQKFIRTFVSETTFAAMEAESSAWMMKCSNCNCERSIWEMGGIRYKAAGDKKLFRPCPNCSLRSWHSLYRKE